MDHTIEAQGLMKRFGRTTALDGLDLVAERGQVVAVLGPNGAGKTTFVRAVATLLTLDAIWSQVSDPTDRRRRLVVVDEAWLLMQQPAGAA